MKNLLGLLCLLLLPNLAFASGATYSLGYYWLNYLVFLALLIFFAKKGVVSLWKSHSKNIERMFNEGRKQLAHSEAKLTQARKDLENIDTEISELQKEIHDSIDSEIQRVKSDGEKTVNGIEKHYQQLVEVENLNIEQELQEELSQYVVSKVKEKVTAHFDEQRDQEYRSTVTSSLGRVN